MTHFVLADAVERVGGGSYQQLVGIVCGKKFQVSIELFRSTHMHHTCVLTFGEINNYITSKLLIESIRMNNNLPQL